MIKLITIALGALALGGTVLAGKLHAYQESGRTERTSESNVTASGASQLRIKVPIGSIKLVAGSSRDLQVHAVRWTKNPQSEEGRRWLEESRLEVRRIGDELTVVDHPYWEGKKEQSTNRNLRGGLDLVIKSPSNLKVRLDISAGSVDAKGSYDAMSGGVGAGQLSVRFETVPQGKTSLSVGAGQVNVELPHGANLDLSADAGIGEITGMPGGEVKRAGMHMGDHRSARAGSGGVGLALHVGAGQISVSSATSLHATARSQGADQTDSADIRMDSDSAESINRTVNVAVGDANRVLDDLEPTLRKASEQSMREAMRALKEAQPEIERAMKEARVEVDRAMKESKPEMDMALVQVGPDVDKALRDIQPELDRELANIGPMIERALREARPEMQRARNEDWARADRDLKNLGPQIDKAMVEANRSIDRAMREMDVHGNEHAEISESVRKAVREALMAAKQAIKESAKASKKAAKEAKDSDSIELNEE